MVVLLVLLLVEVVVVDGDGNLLLGFSEVEQSPTIPTTAIITA